MVTIDGKHLSIADVLAIALDDAPVQLSDDARARMVAARELVERLAVTDRAVYGVNTGFGLMADVRIPADKLVELQYNLVRSHAAGVGEPMSRAEVRATMALRAHVMATGNTGVRPIIAEALMALLNHGVTPVLPQQGSVGASGDLAPLSHLALVLIGEGEAWVDGRRLPGLMALRVAGLEPIELAAKEGLTLVNGTQVMTGTGLIALHRAERLARAADAIGAMTVEVLLGTPRHFDERIMTLRAHPGAITVGANLRRMLGDSEIAASHAQSTHKLQDPYSLRCMPQVHGATRDGIAYVHDVLQREVNACTDNPLVIAEDEDLLNGGNFHGQPVAMALDHLALCVATLANISERRTEQMVNPRESGLPPFLANDPGLESGFMMPHVTAAALVSENKVLTHPASADSIPTSGGQEDHVSMGVTAARKCLRIIENASRVLAIELLAAARGIDLRAPLRPGAGVAALREALLEEHKPWKGDRALGEEMAWTAEALHRGWVEKALEKAGVRLD